MAASPQLKEAPLSKDRALEVYHRTVERSFAFLKDTTRLDDLYAKSLALDDGQGVLVPLSRLHASDTALIETLARWRSENARAYPTRFPVTVEGTQKWVEEKVLEVPDRLLFLVQDAHGRTVGHLGYANCLNPAAEAEIDNVVRGEPDAPKGIMSAAMKAVLRWAHETVGPARIHLRVLDDNPHAIAFYTRLGFHEEGRIPLRIQRKGQVESLVELPSDASSAPDRHFVRMAYHHKAENVGVSMILTAGPSISEREASYVLDAARHGWNRNWSGYLNRFESSFADYLGVDHALATSSCTGALHIALTALGIGPGDEVIVPDITWVATANAVSYVGATPVFADVEPGSWCLDPASFESLITPKTRAVIPVHLYGHPARMDRIAEIARRHDLYIVEDAAPSLGAEVNGRKTGTFGDFAAFSFQGAKVTVTGEGGMLVTNDPELHAKAKKIWDQGRNPDRTFWIDGPGLKYKMSNVQAALGLAQLERVDQLVESKRRIFGWYRDALADAEGIRLNQEEEWARSIYWMTSLMLTSGPSDRRDQVIRALKERNVDTRPVFPTIHKYPIWHGTPTTDAPVSHEISQRAINLPSGVCLTQNEVEYVSRCIKETLHKTTSI